MPPLDIEGEMVPITDEYNYLGFPVTKDGIAFEAFLEQRLRKAKNLTKWLSKYSDDWGPAHRLRVYRQYLAPLWEYGAPLVSAWATERPSLQTRSKSNLHESLFEDATIMHRDIISWVAGCSTNLSAVAANLLGIIPLAIRFEHLRTSFLIVLDKALNANSLGVVLQEKVLTGRACSFSSALTDRTKLKAFLQYRDASLPLHDGFNQWQRRQRLETIAREAQKYKRTRVVDMGCRAENGLFMADVSITAPRQHQELLLQYRLGVFRIRQRCVCSSLFVRGHEKCPQLGIGSTLTRSEKTLRQMMALALVGEGGKFTDLDWLLNTLRTERAIEILQLVARRLGQEYYDGLQEKDMTLEDVDNTVEAEDLAMTTWTETD